MATIKMRPDFLIQKRVANDNRLAASCAYEHKMKGIAQSTQWYEARNKYAFSDGERRSHAFVKQEMDCANAELKLRRRTRLRMLYENETRAYEDELAQLGLAVQREHL
eukprot:CAMPEP_0170620502 /NCGR_PEP_ID=MMETSP0224-20130122/28092_1 /TAXON_ID=285029 /ORGANISM="Togula jolla, Strain CCCM 725" /LENGTH=107 /DNA_ID=CAMNT_0010946679 /DNA_START=83 /DNA_END=406 /DNA_ORIENTATION=-